MWQKQSHDSRTTCLSIHKLYQHDTLSKETKTVTSYVHSSPAERVLLLVTGCFVISTTSSLRVALTRHH